MSVRELSEMEVLLSMTEGFAQLAGDRDNLVAADAETEMWERRGELEPGGMLSSCGGDVGGSLPEPTSHWLTPRSGPNRRGLPRKRSQ